MEHVPDFLDARRVALLRNVLQVANYVPSFLLGLLQPLEEPALPLQNAAVPVGRLFLRRELVIEGGSIVVVGEVWADRSSHIPSLLIFRTLLAHKSVDVFLQLGEAVEYDIFKLITVPFFLLVLRVGVRMVNVLATELLSQRVPVPLLPVEGLECFLGLIVLGC